MRANVHQPAPPEKVASTARSAKVPPLTEALSGGLHFAEERGFERRCRGLL